jgi:hypothetical protein
MCRAGLGDFPCHFVDHLGRYHDQNEIDLRFHGSLHSHFLSPDDWMARGNGDEEKELQTRQKFAVLLTFLGG